MNLERVLIAEFDSHLTELMVVRLSNAGYQVAACTKGDEVLEKALELMLIALSTKNCRKRRAGGLLQLR